MSRLVRDLPARTGGIGPHAGQRLLRGGTPLSRARLAMVMLHGRGGAPEDMAGLARHLAVPDVAVLAPEAGGRSWWPKSFLAPLEDTQPGLGSALSVVDALLCNLAECGFGAERVVIAGFSQGACLALGFAARLARPLRAVAALSGGLVGTGEAGGPPLAALYDHSDKAFDYDGSLDRVPVLIGCHERDPHVPRARIEKSAEVLGRMGAQLETMMIPGTGHGIVAEEAAWMRGRVDGSATADARDASGRGMR